MKKGKSHGNEKLIYAVVFTVVALGLAAVATNPHLMSFSDMNYDSLVEKLKSTGVEVAPQGEVTAPFFSVAGKEISINGNAVQVFEHQDSDSAEAKAKLVSEDGLFVGTQTSDGLELSSVQWGGTPHFYKKGSIIVIYVCDDKEIKNVLAAVLGSQFAGGN